MQLVNNYLNGYQSKLAAPPVKISLDKANFDKLARDRVFNPMSSYLLQREWIKEPLEETYRKK